MIIGIVGSIASGKDTVADYLVKKGFRNFSHSDALRKIMRKEGIETTIQNMTEFGNNLRAEQGYGFLAKQILTEIGEGEDAVVTSIRQVGEIEYYRDNRADFYLLKLDAPKEVRLQRLLQRNRAGDIKSMAELDEIEAKQADGKNGAMNMNRCYELADSEIVNDGSFEDLYKKVDQLVEKLKND
ncbi:MAG: dephospho-CoA kinase [Candidatus Berkelbacteria bacterium]|nr:dephospho-CoA kinase [Candidatus Berkelbacteria bacterium]